MSLSYSFFPDISGQCLSIIVIRKLVIIFSEVEFRTGFPFRAQAVNSLGRAPDA